MFIIISIVEFDYHCQWQIDYFGLNLWMKTYLKCEVERSVIAFNIKANQFQHVM